MHNGFCIPVIFLFYFFLGKRRGGGVLIDVIWARAAVI